MKCPFCAFLESKVVDSRPTEDGEKIRRRRECLSCGKRFTTYEMIENTPLIVIKRDHSRQIFDRNKLMTGLLRACEKRQIPLKELDRLVDSIEQNYANHLVKEVSSMELGEEVLKRLRELDDVAYIRFASVYRDFSDVDSFMKELCQLQKDKS